ncbi:MAG: ABC transporter substrate-binding protein [Streptosporangiaceae bacterium]
MADDNHASQVPRRRFIEMAGVGGLGLLAAACGGGGGGGGGGGKPPAHKAGAGPQPTFMEPSQQLSGDLKILQWHHFVPNYDEWFDPYAKKWGKHVGVNVSVDHIDSQDVVPRAASEISAGSGHDLIMFNFPPSAFEPSLHDLSDVNEEIRKKYGDQHPYCKLSSYNPTTDKYYGFCHSWTPDPGDYIKSLWKQAGMPDGPKTWDDLLKIGPKIKKNQHIPVGIGLSNETDSNMAARALMWSFGASIQDKNEKVVFNSPEMVAAVEFMTKLYKNAMTDTVYAWNPASNNQGLVAGQLSYILNSISAYRTAQQQQPQIANDIYFAPALKGPNGHQGWASEHVIDIYAIPKFSKNVDAAKEFLLNYAHNMPTVTYQSELYNLPAFPKAVPQANGWLKSDPFGSKPKDKLAFLASATEWTTNVGHPGPANPAIGEIFTTFVLPKMMAKAARGKQSPQAAVAATEKDIKQIFEKWRRKGLIGGGG